MAYPQPNPANEVSNLEKLPLEILVMVASSLDLNSLMRFSQCSKIIYNAIHSDLAAPILRKKILPYIFTFTPHGQYSRYRANFFKVIYNFIENSLSARRFELMDLIISFDRYTLGIAVFDLFARQPHLVEFLNSGLLTVGQAMRAPSIEYLNCLLPIGEERSSPVPLGRVSPNHEQNFRWIFDIPHVGNWVNMGFISEYQKQRSRTPVRDHYFEDHYFEDNYYSSRREFNSQRWDEDSLRHQREREHEQIIPQIRENFSIALRENLLTVEQAWAAPRRYEEDSQSYLETLLTPNGLLALRKKWITVEQAWAAPSVDHLGFLLGQKKLIRWDVKTHSDRSGTHSEKGETYWEVQGLEALSSRLLILTVEQAWEAPTADHLGFLLTEEGLIAVRDGLITVDKVWSAIIPKERDYRRNSHRHCLQYLLTPNGLIALRKKLMTVDEALSCSDPVRLKYLFTPNGLTALRENLIFVDQVLHGIEGWNLWYLLTPTGLTALREGLITVEQAARARPHERIDIKESLELLLSQEGLQLLRTGFNVEQALSMGAERLNSLMNPKSIELLITRQVTVDNILALNHDNMQSLLTSNTEGVTSLFNEKLITFEQLLSFQKLDVKLESSSPGYDDYRVKYPDLSFLKIALREQLISFEQVLKVPGKDTSDQYRYFTGLFSESGLTALKGGFKIEQAWLAPSGGHLRCLLSENGLIALKRGFGGFTMERAWSAPSLDHLGCLLTLGGVKLLEAGLITIQQIWAMTHLFSLPKLLASKEFDVQIFRKKFVTIEQISRCQKSNLLNLLFEPNGVIALRKGLINIDQVSRARSEGHLRILLKEGLPALLKKSLTAQEALQYSGDLYGLSALIKHRL